MDIFAERNLKKIIFFSSISLVFLLSLAFGILYITEKQHELKKEITYVEHEFIEQQKQLLKSSVNQLIQQISSRQSLMQARLEENLKKRTREAVSIGTNLYHSDIAQLGVSKSTSIIRESLRLLCTDDAQEYFFILGMDGILYLYPPDPILENKGFVTVFPKIGSEVFKKFKNLLKEKGEGCLRYQWHKPGTPASQLKWKLSYVSNFKPFNWIVGAGEYIDDNTLLTQKSLIKDLNKSMDTLLPDYFFIYDIHNINGGKDFATMLVNPNRPDLIGQFISDDQKDVFGKEYRKEFLAGIRDKGDAYVTYWYKKTNTAKSKKKISYFKLYPEWNWVIAKGTYLDELDEIIAEKKAYLNKEVHQKIYHFIWLLVFSLAIVTVLAHSFSKGISKIIDRYKDEKESQQEKLELINRMLHKQATTDALTGLYNRKFFNDQLAREISRSRRYCNPLSIIMFDIDHFKKINDTFGHVEGDNVLKDLSKLIKNKIRKSDVLARWGGEEFIILSPETSLEQAGVAAEKICTLLNSHVFSIDQQVTCSFGVTQLQPEDKSGDFINRADHALYQAKKSGRNTWYLL